MATTTATRVSEDMTFLPPTPGEGRAQVVDLVEALVSRGHDVPQRVARLMGPGGETVELPKEIFAVLVKVAEAMSAGLAVTVAPRTQTLTTQQAADLLSISRPTLVRLLEEGEIDYTKPGRHRRVLLSDVLAYRERQKARANAALDHVAELDEELGLYDDEADYRDALRDVRKRRATRTKSPSA